MQASDRLATFNRDRFALSGASVEPIVQLLDSNRSSLACAVERPQLPTLPNISKSSSASIMMFQFVGLLAVALWLVKRKVKGKHHGGSNGGVSLVAPLTDPGSETTPVS